MKVEFVAGFRFALRVFLRVFRTSSSTKTNISKFQFDQDRGWCCFLFKYCNLTWRWLAPSSEHDFSITIKYLGCLCENVIGLWDELKYANKQQSYLPAQDVQRIGANFGLTFFLTACSSHGQRSPVRWRWSFLRHNTTSCDSEWHCHLERHSYHARLGFNWCHARKLRLVDGHSCDWSGKSISYTRLHRNLICSWDVTKNCH